MTNGGLNIYCPNCKRLSICSVIPLYKMQKPKGRRLQYKVHADIQWFRRGRECQNCKHRFLTAEVNEAFLDELVELRDRLAHKNQETINRIKNKIPWIIREETIPRELAIRFIRRSAWWLTHSSGRPVRAPGHADRIYQGPHGWAVDFGANSFLVGKAIERCRNEINKYFEEAASGKLIPLSELKQSLRNHISGAVANANGYEYDSYYPVYGGEMTFGAQAINVDDGANFIIQEAELGTLFV